MSISFALTEEEGMIRNEAEKFGKVLYENARKFEKDGVPVSLFDQYKELGFMNMDWPEKLGGQHLPFFVKSLVIEELSKGCFSTTLHLDRPGFAIYPLLYIKDSDTKQAILERFTSHTNTFEPCIFIDVDKRINFKDGKLTGKLFYLPCHDPVLVIILQGNKLFCIEDGITASPVLPCALHAAGACEATIDSKPILYEELEEKVLRNIYTRLRLYIASGILGISRASYEYALKYTQERVAFGKSIAHHQGIAFILADMSIEIAATQLSIWKAAWLLEQDNGFEQSALALIQSQECGLFVTNYGVQLLGGHGYIKDHPVEKWMREARTATVILGGRDAAQIDLEDKMMKEWGFI